MLVRLMPRRRRAGFVLLEVIVSLVILGISVATLMRSFQLSLNAIRKNDVMTQACVLAEQRIQELESEAPKTSRSNGTFEEQGYPSFSWEAVVKDQDIKYRHLKLKNKVDFKPVKHVTLKINYDDKRLRKFTPVEVDLYLMPIERFSYKTKWLNELFLEEEK